jgi:hypothetical protein
MRSLLQMRAQKGLVRETGGFIQNSTGQPFPSIGPAILTIAMPSIDNGWMVTPLDEFGSFFVRNLRDRMLWDLDMLLRGAWKAPAVQSLQAKISRLAEDERGIIREVAEHIITAGMHDLLFALQEQADADGAIRVFVEGEEVATLSDGLHGEIFGEDGWIARFSEYPAEGELQRSREAEGDMRRFLTD